MAPTKTWKDFKDNFRHAFSLEKNLFFFDQFCSSWLCLVLWKGQLCLSSVCLLLWEFFHSIPVDTSIGFITRLLFAFRLQKCSTLYSFFLHFTFSSYFPSEGTWHRHCSVVNYSNAEFNSVVCINVLTINCSHFQTDKH